MDIFINHNQIRYYKSYFRLVQDLIINQNRNSNRGYFRGTEIAIKKIFNPNITQQLLDEINNLLMACCIISHIKIIKYLFNFCLNQFELYTRPSNLVIATEFIQGGSLHHLLHKAKQGKTDQFVIKFQINLHILLPFKLLEHYNICIKLVFYYILKYILEYIQIYNFQLILQYIEILNHIIFYFKDGQKLCDFGLTKRCSELNQGYQQFSGTQTNMAPELFAKRANDKGVDLFAYGTLLWEILTRKVFQDCLEMQEIVQKAMKNEQLPNRNIQKNIIQLINELRCKDETKRPLMDIVIKQLLNR